MITKRLGLVFGVLVAASLILSACAPAGVETVVVTEEVEGEVVERVVTATPPATEEPTPIPPPEMGSPPDTFVYATIGEQETLDPAYHYDTASATVIFNVYDPLIFYDREAIDEFVPALATDWEVSDDGTTYTYTLRDGVTFHQGGTLEAHDAAYAAWRGMLQDRAGGPQWLIIEPLLGAHTLDGFAEEVAGAGVADLSDSQAVQVCEAVKESVTFDDDAGTVTYHLVEPAGFWQQIVASSWLVPLDQEWVADNGGWDGSCETWTDYYDPSAEETILFEQMNGTGPFMLEDWVHGEETVLARYEDYYRTEPIWEGGPSGPAELQRAVIRTVDEWGTRFAMMQAGDVDYAYVPRQFVSQIDPLVKEDCDPAAGECEEINPNGILRRYTNLPQTSSMDGFFTFEVNTEGGNNYIGSGELDGQGIPPDFFSDVHIRRAFYHCFDMDTFINDVWLGEAEQRTGPIISGMIGHIPPEEADFLPEYDLAACEEEFKLADLDGDGIPAGEDEEGDVWTEGFYMNLTHNTGNDQRKAAGEILADGVESVNPNFSIAVFDLPWPTYLQSMVDGRLPLFFIGWLEDYHHPHNWVTPYMAGTGTFSAWQNFPDELYAEFDEGIAEAKALPLDEAGAAYEELQRASVENAIDIFLTQPVGRRYEQLWVQGWYLNNAYPGPWFYPLSKQAE